MRPARALAIAACMALSSCGAWHSTLAPLPGAERSATCTSVAGIPEWAGVEDIAPDPEGGGAYLSVADWRGLARNAAQPGRIYFVSLDGSGGAQAVDRTPEMPRPLFPHGLDVWLPSSPGERRLFAVNHLRGLGPSTIEIFSIGPAGALTWLAESPGPIPALHRPNDIAAAGPLAFYASNDHGRPRTSWFDPPLVETLGDALGRRSAAVVYVDAARGLLRKTPAAFPNGVELSRDGRTLYVSESTRGGLRIFSVQADGLLKLSDTLAAPRLPDNLYLDDAHGLWVASHRNALIFARHARSWSKPTVQPPPSAGRIMRFDLARPDAPPEVVMETTAAGMAAGRGLSAISAATPLGDGFLLGSIFEGARFCRR
jgi:hypothetical protein